MTVLLPELLPSTLNIRSNSRYGKSSCTENSMTHMGDSPSAYLYSLLPSRKRGRATISTPDEDQVDLYDNDVARAIRSNDVDLLRYLLEVEGRSFSGCNRNGESMLHLACRRGELETVEFLLTEAVVPTDTLDCMGRNVLHDVCWRPRPSTELMDLMIRYVSPDLLVQQDVRGHSSFDYCRKENFSEWTQFLRERSSLILRRAKIVGMLQSNS